MRQRASARRRRIVLPEVGDARVQEARTRLAAERLVDPVWVENPAADERLTQVAEHIYDRRKHKGVTAESAVTLAKDPHYFAASLVALGFADGCVAGSSATTAHVVRAAIHCVGLAPTVASVSSMFLMVRDTEALSYADCGVLPEPDTQQLTEIAELTAENHRRFTSAEPRVAFLSFSTKGSADGDSVRKVRQATERFQRRNPSIPADGELQFDAAYVPEVAARKAPGSEVAGRANVLVFPDLDSGNLAYKITERLGGFQAFGPLLQGLRRPCLDLSRGCTADDIVWVAALAALMA
ncbi:MAG: phosphotransacetylase [Planctomycetota bacterium]